MAILNSCCCWKSIRKACYVCAVFSFIYYLFLIITVWQNYFQSHAEEEMPQPHHSVLVPEAPEADSWIIYVLKLYLICSIIGTFTSILLIIGIWKDKKLLLLPWIIDTPLIILLDVIYVAHLGYERRMSPKPEVAMVLTLDFFLLIVNFYALLCVISQFQEYKAGRGRVIDERPETGLSSAIHSCETGGRRNVTIYESKSQAANGISPRHSRMSFRNPSIKISRVDKNNIDDKNHADKTTFEPLHHGPSVNDKSSFIHLDGAPSTPSTSSTTASLIQRSESKKKVQFPNTDSERDSSTAEPVADISETSATTECESSTGRDWDKSLENSPLILIPSHPITKDKY